MSNQGRNYKYLEQLAKVQQHREMSKPKTPAKNLVNSEKQSSPVLSEHAKEMTIWEDVLWAIMNQTPGQISDRIKRIRNPPARQKFQKITDELFYLQMRKQNLKRKIDSLNDLLKKLLEHKLIKPDLKIQEDNHQQIDMETIKKIIKLTNQGKILTALIETDGKDPVQQLQALKVYADCRSAMKLKHIINDNDYYKSNFKPNLQKETQLKNEIESLKKIKDQLQRTNSQLEKDKQHMHSQLVNKSPGGFQESKSNQKAGIGVTQAKGIELNPRTEDHKSKPTEQQFNQLKDINAKKSRDQGLLTAAARRHQTEIQKYKMEERKLKIQLERITRQYKSQIERLELSNNFNFEQHNLYKIKYECVSQEKNHLQDQNQSLKKKLVQKEGIIMSERRQSQKVIQEVTINAEKISKSQKALTFKIQQLQRQLQSQKVRYATLNMDKTMIEHTLKRTLQDKDLQNENIYYIRQQYQGKINKLQIQVEKLNKKIKQIQTEKHSLSRKIQQSKNLANNQIVAFKRQNEQASNQQRLTIDGLSNQNRNLNARIAQIIDNKSRQWKQNSDHHKMEVTSKDKQISELKNNNQLQEQKVLSLSKQLQTLIEEINILSSHNQDTQKQLSSLIDQKNASLSQLQFLANDNQRLIKDNQAKQADLSRVKDQLESLELQSKQKEPIKDDENQIKHLKQYCQRQKSELLDKDKRIIKLQQQVSTKNDELRSLKKNYQQVLSEKDKLAQAHQQNLNYSSRLQQQKATSTKINLQKQVQTTALLSQNQQIRKKIESLRQSIDILQAQAIASNQEKCKLRQQANKKWGQLQQMKSSIEGLQDQLNNQIQKCKDLQTIKEQIENEKINIEEASNKRQQQLDKYLQRVMQEYERVKSELQYQKNQNLSLIQKLQLSQQHYKDLKAERNFIEKQLTDYKLKTTKQQYVNDSISIIQLGQSADPATNAQNVQSLIITEQIQRQQELEAIKKELEECKQRIADEQARFSELEMQKELLLRQKDDTIRQLGQGIERLSSQNAGLKQNIQALRLQHNRQCEQLKKANADLKAQNDEMIEKSRESQERFGEVMNNCTQQSDRRIQQLNQTITRLQSQNAELQIIKLKLDDAQGRINQIELEKECLKGQRDLIKAAKEQIETELQANNSKTTQQTAKFEAVIDEKQRLIDELMERLRAQDQSLEAAQSQLQVRTIEIAQMNEKQAKFDEKERSYKDKQLPRMNKIQQLNSQIAQLQKDNQGLNIVIQQRQSEITNINESNEQLQKNYESQAREHQKARENWERQIVCLKQKIEGVEKDLHKVQLHKGSLISSLAQKQQENEEKKKKISQLEERVEVLTKENSNYQDTLNLIKSQIALTHKHTVDLIESKDIQISHLAQQIVKLNGDLRILSAKNQQLDKLFEQLQTRNDELGRENAEMIEKARESQERFGDMMNYSMQDYDDRIKVLEDGNALLKAELQKAQRERQRLQAKNKKYEKEIDDLTHQVQILNETLEEVNKFNQSMEAKCEEKEKQADIQELAQSMRAVGQKETEIAELKYDVKNLQEQLIKKERQIAGLELKVERLQKVQDELDFSVGQLNRQRIKEREYQQTLSLKQGQLTILSDEKQRLKAEQEKYMKQSRQDIQKVQQRLQTLQQELMLREKDPDGTLRAIFQHKILHQHPNYKQFLKESIQQQCNGRIIKTWLVYRYDPINKVNFHQYIDNLENIVVIIKLANGSYIAGFTEDSLNVDKRQTQKTGLIMSLTNKQVFKLAEQNKKAATYDQYYMIFGNSEIRIKSQEKKVYSNFGISNSYFKSRGFKVETLLGGSPKESQVDFETFEVYQLEIINDF